jgi:hypothetical protein
VCGARLVSDALTGQKFVTLRIPLSSIDLDERRGRSGRQKVRDKLLRAQAEKEKEQS